MTAKVSQSICWQLMWIMGHCHQPSSAIAATTTTIESQQEGGKDFVLGYTVQIREVSGGSDKHVQLSHQPLSGYFHRWLKFGPSASKADALVFWSNSCWPVKDEDLHWSGRPRLVWTCQILEAKQGQLWLVFGGRSPRKLRVVAKRQAVNGKPPLNILYLQNPTELP